MNLQPLSFTTAWEDFMDRNVHFLNAIYQDANGLSQSLDALLPKAKDPLMVSEMQRQRSEYQAISHQAETLIGAYEATPVKPNPAADAAALAGQKLAATLDDSHSGIARLLIKEGTQGVANMTRMVKGYCCCDQPVTALGQKLLKTRKAQVEGLQKYL